MASTSTSDHTPTDDSLYLLHGADGNRYLVPKYLLDQVGFEALARHLSSEMPTDPRDSAMPEPTNSPFIRLAGGILKVPADPVHSTIEARRLHAQVLAAREKWGISYKDAAHRLYMASISELKAHEEHANELQNLLSDIDNALAQPGHTPSPPLDESQPEPHATE